MSENEERGDDSEGAVQAQPVQATETEEKSPPEKGGKPWLILVTMGMLLVTTLTALHEKVEARTAEQKLKEAQKDGCQDALDTQQKEVKLLKQLPLEARCQQAPALLKEHEEKITQKCDNQVSPKSIEAFQAGIKSSLEMLTAGCNK